MGPCELLMMKAPTAPRDRSADQKTGNIRRLHRLRRFLFDAAIALAGYDHRESRFGGFLTLLIAFKPAKGIAFPVGRLFKPGYSLNARVAVADRTAPA